MRNWFESEVKSAMRPVSGFAGRVSTAQSQSASGRGGFYASLYRFASEAPLVDEAQHVGFGGHGAGEGREGCGLPQDAHGGFVQFAVRRAPPYLQVAQRAI